MKLLVRFLATVVALVLIAQYLSGFSVGGWVAAAEVAVVLGLVNLLIRPVILLITLPVNLLTLGLFTFVINAFLILLVSFIAPYIPGLAFHVTGFMPALYAALILAVVHWVMHRIT